MSKKERKRLAARLMQVEQKTLECCLCTKLGTHVEKDDETVPRPRYCGRHSAARARTGACMLQAIPTSWLRELEKTNAV